MRENTFHVVPSLSWQTIRFESRLAFKIEHRFLHLKLHRDETPAKLSVSWRALGLQANQSMAVRDVVNRRDLSHMTAGQFESVVGKHDVAFIRLSPLPAVAAEGMSM